MRLVVAPVHRIQRALLHTLAELLAEAARYHWLQLLEVSHHSCEWRVRLLLNTHEEALPLSILILTGFVAQDKVDTPQR